MYKLKTEMINGVEKIVSVSSQKDARKKEYCVIKGKGPGFIVDKQWVINNIDKISNVRVSGTSLYLVSDKGKEEKSVKKATSTNTKSKLPFKLVERSPQQVILKVVIKDNLTIAKHPYIDSNMDYITVTRGKNHILTVIKKDGGTYSFDWGESGYTMISNSLEMLKKAVIQFIEDEKHIPLEWDDGKVHNASIYYNSSFSSWQLTLEGQRSPRLCTAHIWDKNSKSAEDMMEYAKHYINVKQWVKGKAKTGIDIWRAQL